MVSFHKIGTLLHSILLRYIYPQFTRYQSHPQRLDIIGTPQIIDYKSYNSTLQHRSMNKSSKTQDDGGSIAIVSHSEADEQSCLTDTEWIEFCGEGDDSPAQDMFLASPSTMANSDFKVNIDIHRYRQTECKHGDNDNVTRQTATSVNFKQNDATPAGCAVVSPSSKSNFDKADCASRPTHEYCMSLVSGSHGIVAPKKLGTDYKPRNNDVILGST